MDNPYAAPQSSLDNAANDRTYVLASPWRRLAAFLLNLLLILFLPLTALAVAAEGAGILLNLLCICTAGTLLVMQIHGLVKHQQSLAKKWLGIKVCRQDGSRCHGARLIVGRELLPLLLLPAVPLALLEFTRLATRWDDLAWLIFSGALVYLMESACLLLPGRQALHDRLCATIVIREEPSHA